MEFKKVYWVDVEKAFTHINLELSQIITNLSPNKEHYFYQAEYNYGSYILKKGKLQIPVDGKIFPLHHSSINSVVQNDLNYNLGTNPVSTTLNNTVEIFTEIDNSIIPLYGLIQPGAVFSTSRVLSPKKSHAPTLIWDMTAGARSIFIPQKISEKRANAALTRAYQLRTSSPKTMIAQWHTFREIVNHPSWGEPWKTTILFFTRAWFEHLDDPAWQSFYYYLYRAAWVSSDFWRNDFLWDMVFSAIQTKKNIKAPPYIDAVARHLLSIGVGASPGFSLATDQTVAPLDRLITCYRDVYKNCENYSTFLMPKFYDKSHPVYLSLNLRTWLNAPLKKSEQDSLIKEEVEIKSLLNRYIKELASDELNIVGSTMENLVHEVGFKFFHGGKEPHFDIHNSTEITEHDKFLKIHDNMALASSPFFRGCIQIDKK